MKNNVELTGTITVGYALDHVIGDKKFYSATIRCFRKSGTADFVPVILPEGLIIDAGRISVAGELRTYNTPQRHLKMYVYAENVSRSDDADANECCIDGTICDPKPIRRTLSGHYICKAILAVNRSYGKSSYIPCIAWSSVAYQLSACNVGDNVSVSGRIQSRLYLKEQEHFTCYELSLNHIEKRSEP